MRAQGAWGDRQRGIVVTVLSAGALVTPALARAQASRHEATVTVTEPSPDRRHRFDPRIALGATVDGHDSGATHRVFPIANQLAMLETGLGALSYRLRTELGNEVWHWNPRGRWSDAAGARGYWISDSTRGAPIDVSYGYRLPRRGNTVDQANDDGYSRLTDGDTATFWKSNPYLAPPFTGRPESEHPSWLIVDFGAPTDVSALRVRWADPYATALTVEYWAGDVREPIETNPQGAWRVFPRGTVTAVRGGDQTIPLGDVVRTRFLRLRFGPSSGTALPASRDTRDSLGVAVRELYAGTLDATGLRDAMRHSTRGTVQTRIIVSSTDPWHRASDLDPDTEQPGIDLVFQSRLGRGLPTLVPVGVLYDVPENGAALLAYLRARAALLDGIELGEEPDGQYVTPEDYAALYGQVARALRAVDGTVRLGGPSWQDPTNAEMRAWPARTGPGRRSTWIGRFLDALDAQHDAGAFQFFSFEWYPFDEVCDPPAPQVAAAPTMLAAALDRLRAAGLPDSIPRYISEYGYSPFAGAPEVRMDGALLNTETAAGFLAAGGARAYLYGYEPGLLERNERCESWGNQLVLLADSVGRVRARLATFYAAQLLTTAWLDPRGGTHEMLSTRFTAGAPAGTPPIGAYAARRPDHRVGVLLVNRDPRQAWRVNLETAVRADGPDGGLPVASDVAEIWQYGREEYAWRADGPAGRPIRSRPPRHRRALGAAARSIVLPPWSIGVVVLGPA